MGYKLCASEIMTKSITPKVQPVDAFIGKVYNGNYRDYYDLYILDALLNNKGQSIAPTRQIYEKWAVKTWNKYQNR